MPFPGLAETGFSFVARTATPGALVPDLTRLVTSLEPRGPWLDVEPASAIVARLTAPWRLLTQAGSMLSGVALVLAIVGLYAVVAYVVSLRTREIGIRMAVGAQAADVVQLVIGQATRSLIAGSIVGLAAGLLVARAMRGVLLGISPVDPLAVVPAVALLTLTASIAAIVPARRAARIDPVAALRE